MRWQLHRHAMLLRPSAAVIEAFGPALWIVDDPTREVEVQTLPARFEVV